MTAEAKAILEADDARFVVNWSGMTSEQRSAIGALGFDRFRKLTPEIGKSLLWAERGTAKRNGQDVIKTGTSEWPAPLDLDVLAKREPELPRFVIDNWLPCGYSTLLAGHGGIGKSSVALHLAVCIAGGIPFFGLQVQRRRVLYLSCEDRESVLHWRLSRICSHLSIDLAHLRGWLEILDLVGADSILWERDPQTGNATTLAYGHLQERMREHETEVLMVDGVSDTFAGNENARGEVKRFVNGLVAQIPPDTGAVLLIGHVSKPGSMAGANGDGYSGSTSWHNSVRARWYLYPETTQAEDGERSARTGDLILELQKSNMGRTDQSIRFAWDEDARLFLGREIMGATQFDRLQREREEKAGILAAFKGCGVAGISVPAAMQGPRTAYLVLSLRPEFPDSLRKSNPATKGRFRRRIEELRQSRAIEECEYRRSNGHKTAAFRITTEGLRQYAE